MNRRFTSVAVLLSLMVFCHHQTASAHFEDWPDSKQSPEKSAAKIEIPASFNCDPWKLLELALSPAFAASSNVTISLEGPYRIVRSNGIPNHTTGIFPNAGNPNTIREQHYTFRMPASPQETGTMTPLGMNSFGVAVNGIPFDPGAAEFFNNDRTSGWQYEAMALGPRLGIDQNNAHVQPNGAYHYHGLPTGLLDRLSGAPQPVLFGYAADGFPIYGPFGHSALKDLKSPMKKLRSSYRKKMGTRPSGPGGRYDGSFVQDYEYVAGLGDLDDCNGRFGATTEYPRGTYHYVISDSFPFIPRAYKGSPDPSFRKRPGRGFGPPRGPGFGPPGPGFGPPGDFDPRFRPRD